MWYALTLQSSFCVKAASVYREARPTFILCGRKRVIVAKFLYQARVCCWKVNPALGPGVALTWTFGRSF